MVNTPSTDKNLLSERQTAKVNAANESRRADQKQHADKLLQGFAKIDDNAPNRAIWELVQNACDLTTECRVTLDYRNKGFAFSHNGKPFTSKTLIALIKQVSSKGDNVNEQVGQFGTGFITTHAFGRRFTINSLLDVNGLMIKIKDFLIDRTPKDWEEMVKKLEMQEQLVYDMIEIGEIVENPFCKTTLTYLPESDIESRYIDNSFTHLNEYIPIVLAINERLKSVTVISADGKQETYTKGNKEQRKDIWVTAIEVSDGIREVFSLRNEQDELEVILPLKTENEAYLISQSIAKLFLYYPLIGTENWGCNYIIHSRLFKPTEPRDGIHLNSNNEQVKIDEEVNRGIITMASELIFDFVSKNVRTIVNPIHLAYVRFETNGEKDNLNDYFKSLKEQWISKFKHFLLVETAIGNMKPADVAFIHKDLLWDDFVTQSVYDLIHDKWKNIPKCNLTVEWTNIVDDWRDGEVKYKTISDLAIEIQEKGDLDIIGNNEALISVYNYLLKYGHGDLFNKYQLLPNIDNKLKNLSELNNKVNLPPVLIQISRILAPIIPGKHIHEAFMFSFILPPYKRSDYSKDVTDIITKVLKESSTSQMIDRPLFEKMLDFCRISTSAGSVSAPSRILKLICRYYDYPNELIEIPISEEEFVDNRTVQKRLLQVFLNDISNHDSIWVNDQLDVLKELISTMRSFKEYHDLLLTARIFPNQLNELCVQSKLKVDREIPSELKDIYNRICSPNDPIDSKLVLHGFEIYLENQEERTSKSLGSEIESILSGDGYYHNINSHPYQNDIIRIIELITAKEYLQQYFPQLNIRKANIMLDRLSGPTRSSMFKIMNLSSDKVNVLGKLAEKEDFEKIIELGLSASNQMRAVLDKLVALPPAQVDALGEISNNGYLEKLIALGLSALEDEHRTKADFQFKYEIGKRIESLIKDRINEGLVKYRVEVEDVQNGQDIIIFKEAEAIFFIEVKSRWKASSSIMMSKNQFMNAAKNKEKHSLCCVEMSDYKIGDPSRYTVDNVSIIFDRIKFVNTVGTELAPLVMGIFKSTDVENEITLTGDYKATIPQRLVKSGLDINEFIEWVVLTHLSSSFS